MAVGSSKTFTSSAEITVYLMRSHWTVHGFCNFLCYYHHVCLMFNTKLCVTCVKQGIKSIPTCLHFDGRSLTNSLQPLSWQILRKDSWAQQEVEKHCWLRWKINVIVYLLVLSVYLFHSGVWSERFYLKQTISLCCSAVETVFHLIT